MDYSLSLTEVRGILRNTPKAVDRFIEYEQGVRSGDNRGLGLGGMACMTKVCNKCGEEKPLTKEYFHARKPRGLDGFRGECRTCSNAYNRQYRKENEERIKKYMDRYRKENKGQIAARDKEYRKENEGKYREYDRQYRKENKEKCTTNAQKYRSRRKQLESTLTAERWRRIKKDLNYKCVYCGMEEREHVAKFNEQLHQEHFIPLSKGGAYTQENITPSCRSCNSSKQNKDFFEWYLEQPYYDTAKAFKIIEHLSSQKKTEFERMFAKKELYEDWMLSTKVITADGLGLIIELRAKMDELDKKIQVVI